MRLSTKIVVGSFLAAAATAAIAVLSHLQLKAVAADARGIEEEWNEMDRVASALVALHRAEGDGRRVPGLLREAARLRAMGGHEHSAPFPGADPEAHEERERAMCVALAAICERAAGELDPVRLAQLGEEAERVALAFWEEDRGGVPARAEEIGRKERRMHAVNLASSAGLLLLPLLFLVWVRLRVAKPLTAIQRRVAAIGGVAPDPGAAGSEMARLARSIEAMAEAVGSRHRSLEEAVAERTAQLRHADRLGGLGRIAAAVAHEINNPLASIALCLDGLGEGLRASPPDVAEATRNLDTMRSEIDRCTQTTRKLLTYARYRPEEPRTLDPAELLRGARDMAQGYAGRARVAIEVATAPGAPKVRGEEGQLRQVLLNLLLNAVDASPRGATVRVRAEAGEGGLVVRVEDEGEGVPAGMEESIFQPFVTTKRAGEGTGLGLAIAREIAEAHRGSLRLARERGPRGAVFELRLPGCVEQGA